VGCPSPAPRAVDRVDEVADPSGDRAQLPDWPRQAYGDVYLALDRAKVARLGDEIDFQVGICLKEQGQSWQQQPVDDHRHGGHAHPASSDAIRACDSGQQPLDLLLDSLGPLSRRPTGFGRRQLTPAAFKKPRSQLSLDPRDAPPHRHLVDRKTPRRLGDGREPSQREHVAEIIPGNRLHFCSLDRQNCLCHRFRAALKIASLN
jgi:hypothetical protein